MTARLSVALWIGLFLLSSGSTLADAQCPTLPGDVDQSGIVNVVDVQCTILVTFWFLGDQIGSLPGCVGSDVTLADIQCDGVTDVSDVLLVVGMSFGNDIPQVLDINRNGCPDSCEAVCGDGICLSEESCDGCPIDCGPCSSACCVSSAQPGCASDDCQSCVCSQDPFCCESAWDFLCVATAGVDCSTNEAGAPCYCEPPCPPTSCCNSQNCPGCATNPVCESAVCAVDPSCCEATWNETCATLALQLCDECIVGPGDCCAAGAAAGCNDVLCQDCVCMDDPFCCNVSWDLLCAVQTASNCADQCPCAEAASQGDCCVPGADAGCSDGACEVCVCEIDAFCCDVQWDTLCTAQAGTECSAWSTVGPCFCKPPCPKQSCCLSGSCPGCLDTACASAVCQEHPTCCQETWSQFCATIALSKCVGCGGGKQSCCTTHLSPGCNQAACELCVCDLDPFCCNTSWDIVCVAEATQDCPQSCVCQ